MTLNQQNRKERNEQKPKRCRCGRGQGRCSREATVNGLCSFCASDPVCTKDRRGAVS